MSSKQKIQKQVHTASILICSNDSSRSFKSATWIRKNDSIQKIIKKELFSGKSESVYNCTLFDFGSCINLQLQNSEEMIKQFQYGPVKLDQKLLTMVQQEAGSANLFEVTVLLNKNQKYLGKISFSRKQQNMFIFHINIENLDINLEYALFQKWCNYQQILTLRNDHPNSIFINLSSNKMHFIKNLSKIKIYCHYGNNIQVNFNSDDLRNLFLLKFMDFACLRDRIKQLVQVKKSQHIITNTNSIVNQNIRQSDLFNLFASTQLFSNPHTPEVPDKVLEDLRNIVFTPKPQFQRQVRQRGFGNFDNFLNGQSHKHTSKAMQNLVTNSTIKQQQAQIQIQVQAQEQIQTKRQPKKSNKLSTSKSHEFIFNFNKNKKQSKWHLDCNHMQDGWKSKQKHYLNSQARISQGKKKSQEKRISYQKIQERNKFLQQQNKILLLENQRLRITLQTFINFGTIERNHLLQKQKYYCIPEFLKQKNGHANGNGFGHGNRNVNNATSYTINMPMHMHTSNEGHKMPFRRTSQVVLQSNNWGYRNNRMTDSSRQQSNNIRGSGDAKNLKIPKSRDKTASKSKNKNRIYQSYMHRLQGQKNGGMKYSMKSNQNNGNNNHSYRFFKTST